MLDYGQDLPLSAVLAPYPGYAPGPVLDVQTPQFGPIFFGSPMWNFLLDYGLFLLKFGTVVAAIAALFFVVAMLKMRARGSADGHLEVKNINQKFEHMQLLMESAILPKGAFKKSVKEHKSKQKKAEKADTAEKRRIFVINFKGDIRADEVASLREEISAILTIAAGSDEVLVVLESGGGSAHGYGLAASQLRRMREKNIPLTVAVDKVAASGGYMMACVANKIIAAPFAIIGSIGVLAQMPNFHKLLKKHDIDFEQISAGKYKRTLSLFGENTEEGREKLRAEIEETHELFKQFVRENRAQVNVEEISTGEHWHGKKALELGLVDALQTSDDYLSEAAKTADIYEISFARKKSFMEKLFSSTTSLSGVPTDYTGRGLWGLFGRD